MIRRRCLGKIFSILWLFCCSPLLAQTHNEWQSEGPPLKSSLPKSDSQQIYEVLLNMLDGWNAHDIDAYLKVYCKSAELLVVVDSEQFNDSYAKGYLDPAALEFIQPKRIQVKLLRPDLALALTWWSITFPNSKQ